MFAQYFGHFLLNRGLVSADNLERAMAAQKETRVKLGVLAINIGYMTADQVEEVHQAQTRMDKRFGEIAVELGYVTNEQVSELLSSQQTEHLALGQSLIDLGIMNYERFSSALNQYKAEHSLSDEQFESIIRGDIEALLQAQLLKGSLAGNRQWTDYINLFAKNCIRFLDSDIRLEQRAAGVNTPYDWVVQQPLANADRSLLRATALAGSEAAFLQLASVFAGEAVNEPGEMMEAAVGEFLNLHNGIFLVNESNQGLELDLNPQSVVRGAEFRSEQQTKAVIRVVGSRFEFDLIVENLAELA